MKTILLAATFFCFLNFTLAQPGELDSSFGTNGVVTANFEGYSTLFKSTAIQTDGKIVVAGTVTYNPYTSSFAVTRFNTDGSLDNTFNQNGKVLTNFDFSQSSANAVAIQEDGKIIAAGSSDGDFALARYNTDGSLDNTFDGDGTVTTDISGYDAVRSIAIQKDGKIVVAGEVDGNEQPYFGLARYNTNGSLDTTFDGDGKLTTHYEKDGKNYTRQAVSIAIQSNEKIVVAGEGDYASFTVARYNIDGSLDNSFNGNGIQITQVTNSQAYPSSVAVQDDGQIVVGGSGNNYPGPFDFYLVRYNTNGSLDNSLNGDGIKNISFITNTSENLPFALSSSLVLQNDGKILLAGTVSYPPSNSDHSYFAIARCNSDGSLDSTFSDDGLQTTDVTETYNQIFNIAIGNNRLYAVGLAGYNATFGIVQKYFLDGSRPSIIRITNPINERSYEASKTINITATATPYTGGHINKSELYIDSALIYTDTSHSFSIKYSWKNAPAGNHTLMAKITDDRGLVTVSAIVNISVLFKKPPVVSITSPDNYANYDAPADITLKASASDQNTDGSISQVAFYRGTTLLATDDTSPYTYEWKNVPDGYYTITAQATNNSGLVTTSGETAITVVRQISNIPPGVSITNPVNNTTFAGPATVRLSADAYDYDGTVSKVEYYIGVTLLATVTQYPYVYDWLQVPLGSYIVTAIATDNLGLVSAPDTIRISVVSNTAPTVSIIKPADNKIYLAPANINLEAAANDPGGAITQVAFYNGSTFLGIVYEAPYTYTWSNVPVGNYTITAKATDNLGAIVTSAPVHVAVVPNKAPTVSITNPVNNPAFAAPAYIHFEAAASDPDGRITRVEFYSDSTLLSTEYKAPYKYVWKNLPVGIYTLTAVATDNWGAQTMSAPVTIKVKAFNTTIVSSKPNAETNDVDTKTAISIKAWPNPADKTMTISTIGLQGNNPTTISILSATGIIMKTVSSNSSAQNIPLNVSSLTSGVYTIKMLCGDKVLYKQFIKL